ncbi:MAG: TonB family protein, partial [Pseudomonadota bacterium]
IATATAIRAPDRAPEATVQPTLDPSLDQVDAAATEPATAVTAEPVPTDADVVPTEVEQTVETARLRPAETVTATTSAPEATPVETAMPAPPRRPRDLAPARTRTPTRTASTRPDPTPARTTPQRETRRAPTPAEEPAPTRPTPDTQTASRGDPTAAPREDAGSGSTAGASGGSGDNSGPAASQSAGGDPGARRDYLARIVAILSGIRDRYPRAARRRNLEGTGQLYLAIQADGSIGAWRLTSSTGHTILDDTIMDYRARVSFPPIPEELNRPTFVIEVPITFETR